MGQLDLATQIDDDENAVAHHRLLDRSLVSSYKSSKRAIA
jgi:hypothetical protein